MLLLFFAVFEIITAVHGFQFLDEFAVGNGFAEVVALDPFAASLLEEAELLGGFHAFGQGVYVEGLGEHDHGSDDFLGFVAEVPHEAHVDLDFVEVEVTQGSERGIGAAEVVHQDFIAGFAEECHLFFDLGRIGHQGGLGDFHAEHFRLEVVFLNGFLEFFVRIAGLEVGSGEVEGNGHDWCAFFDAFPEVSGNLTDDVNVELVGEVRCFEDGDEFARQNERARPLRRRHVLTITEFNDSLSLALAPITLISGVGLLMICMTNRYNHATNRIRQLMAKREGNIDNSIIRSVIDTEIDLLYMRASLLRRGMLSVALSAFFSAILVAVSVSARFLDLDIHILESCILVAAVLLIVLSALLFAGEINVSLKALKLAVDKVPRHGKWSLED